MIRTGQRGGQIPERIKYRCKKDREYVKTEFFYSPFFVSAFKLKNPTIPFAICFYPACSASIDNRFSPVFRGIHGLLSVV
jgi:hypothetical protein